MENFKYKPVGTDILVELPVVNETTKAGVIKSKEMLKEEKKNQNKFLKVIKVGSKVTEVKPGDMILPANLMSLPIEGYGIASESSIVLVEIGE